MISGSGQPDSHPVSQYQEQGATVQLNDAVKQFSASSATRTGQAESGDNARSSLIARQAESELLSFQKGDQTTPLYREACAS